MKAPSALIKAACHPRGSVSLFPREVEVDEGRAGWTWHHERHKNDKGDMLDEGSGKQAVQSPSACSGSLFQLQADSIIISGAPVPFLESHHLRRRECQ